MEFEGNKPIYVQIADYIMQQILNGVWQLEQKIPSVRDLSAQLNVNHNTVMRAYDLLQQDDIILMKRGLGFFVNKTAQATIHQYRKALFVRNTLPNLYAEMQLLNMSFSEFQQLYKQFVKEQA